MKMHMRMPGALLLACLLLLAAGCPGPSPRALDGLKAMNQRGDFQAIAGTTVDCRDRTAVCVQEHQIKADACLWLGRGMVVGGGLDDAGRDRVRGYYDCAVDNYMAAETAMAGDLDRALARDVRIGLAESLMERRQRARTPEEATGYDARLLDVAGRLAQPPSSDPGAGAFYAAATRLSMADAFGAAPTARCADLAEAAALLPAARDVAAVPGRSRDDLERRLADRKRLYGCPA